MAWRAPCPEGEQRVKARGASTSVVRIRRTDLHLGGGLGIPGSCAPSPILPLLLSCGRVVVSEGGVCAPVLGAVTVWEGAACLPGWQTSEGPAGRGDEGGMKPRVQESCHQVGGREPGPMARRLPLCPPRGVRWTGLQPRPRALYTLDPGFPPALVRDPEVPCCWWHHEAARVWVLGSHPGKLPCARGPPKGGLRAQDPRL